MERHTGNNMDLQEAQNTAWVQQVSPPQTTRDALGQLAEAVQETLQAFQADQLLHAQSALEDSLAHVLIAMKSFGLEAERGFVRAITRMQQASGQRIFHIFQDRVELWVAGEYRGGWPLYTDEDYEAALKMARELGCEVLHQEAQQLGLFQSHQPMAG